MHLVGPLNSPQNDLAAASAHNFDNLLLAVADDSTVAAATTSFFSSLLISAYTTFECISIDIWVRAVNKRPKSLAKNVLGKPRGCLIRRNPATVKKPKRKVSRPFHTRFSQNTTST